MSDSEEEIDDTLKNPDIVNKYKASGQVVQAALTKVLEALAPGKKIYDLCVLGDKTILELIGKQFNNKKGMEKGIAFPTCISVNNTVGHFSPLASDTTVLEEGDLVKIDLGAHFDGVIAVAAHTAVVNTTDQPASGKKADVICAAHFAAEAALKLIKVGNKNTQVTEAIARVAESFKCNPVEGVLSHSLHRFVIDGTRTIINKQTAEQKVDEFTFEPNEVYAIDIVLSTGEGKAKEQEARTTVYRRVPEQAYSLKLKASRQLLSEIQSKAPSLPFSLRIIEDEKKAKLGLTECVKHDLLYSYPVLLEKPGEFVAQFKFNVLLLPSGTKKLTAFNLPHVSSEYSLADPALCKLLSLPLPPGVEGAAAAEPAAEGASEGAAAGGAKKKKNKKKKKGAAGAAESTPAAEQPSTTTSTTTAAATPAPAAESTPAAAPAAESTTPAPAETK